MNGQMCNAITHAPDEAEADGRRSPAFHFHWSIWLRKSLEMKSRIPASHSVLQLDDTGTHVWMLFLLSLSELVSFATT